MTTTKTPRPTAPVAWSLRNEAIEDFRRFSQALLEFHEDRQVYFVARHSPDVLKEDDIVRVLFVGRRDDADSNWLDGRLTESISRASSRRTAQPDEAEPVADIDPVMAEVR